MPAVGTEIKVDLFRYLGGDGSQDGRWYPAAGPKTTPDPGWGRIVVGQK